MISNHKNSESRFKDFRFKTKVIWSPEQKRTALSELLQALVVVLAIGLIFMIGVYF